MEIPTLSIFCFLYTQEEKEKSRIPFGQSQVDSTLSSPGALEKNFWLACNLPSPPISFNAFFFSLNQGEREDE